MLVLGLSWLAYRQRSARLSGEGYGATPTSIADLTVALRKHAQGEGHDLAELGPRQADGAGTPGMAVALAPIARWWR